MNIFFLFLTANLILALGRSKVLPLGIGATYFFDSLALILVFCTLYNCSRFPGNGRTKKVLFLSRLLAYIPGPFNLMASVSSQSNHGVESAAIYRIIYSNSKGRSRQKTIYLWMMMLSFLFFLICAPWGLYLYLNRWFPKYDGLLVFFGLLSFTTSYMHFYLESLVFRMKDKRIRQNIGPLLICDPIPSNG